MDLVIISSLPEPAQDENGTLGCSLLVFPGLGFYGLGYNITTPLQRNMVCRPITLHPKAYSPYPKPENQLITLNPSLQP